MSVMVNTGTHTLTLFNVHCPCRTVHISSGQRTVSSSWSHFSFIIAVCGEWRNGDAETDSCLADRCWISDSSQLSSTTNNTTPPPPPFKTDPRPVPHPLFTSSPSSLLHPPPQNTEPLHPLQKHFSAEFIQGIPPSLVRVVIARWAHRPAGSRVMRGCRVLRALMNWGTHGK